jgi:RimJ/RimL family protein N-acetyltransferase
MTPRIVRFEPAHLAGFEEMLDDPDVARFTPLPSPAPTGYALAWLDRYEAGRADGTREAFAILEDERFLGIAVAPVINRAARECELGYVVAPSARGRGVASAALLELTRWAFEEQDVVRAFLRIHVANDGSRAVARRAGYRYEGTLRGTWLKGDLRADTEMWSRLRTDPVPNRS